MKGQARLAAAVVVAVRIGAATVALGVALLLGDIVNLRTLALEPAANNEGAFVTRATALANSARAYMNTYVPGVIQEVATDRAAARSVRTTALGKQLVDGIRSQTQHPRAADQRASGGASAVRARVREPCRDGRNRRPDRRHRAHARAEWLPRMAARGPRASS